MKKIIISYFAMTKCPSCKYEHNQEFPYSKGRKNSLIEYFLKKEFNVMIRISGETLIIFVDKGNFKQR